MSISSQHIVLILVLMEDTLRAYKYSEEYKQKESLNPCFNGRYSQRQKLKLSKKQPLRLNPCFNGRYSQSIDLAAQGGFECLNPCFNGRYSQRLIINPLRKFNIELQSQVLV